MLDVAIGLGRVQRQQVVARRDALGQLAQVGARGQVLELGLTDEHDLQQLVTRGLEVGEQPDLLEYLGREVLRLVDHGNRAPTAAVGLEQVGVECLRECSAAVGRFGQRDVELLEDHGQEFRGRELRVEHERNIGLFGHALQQAANECRLAGADLAREHDEAVALRDAVDQVRERLRVTLAHEEIARVRRDRERTFVEAEEIEIHGRWSVTW